MPSLNKNLTGREYWQSVQQLADSPELNERFEQEFAGYDPNALLSMSRRGFMKVMGASMALAGLTLTGCRRWPEQELRPFSHRPENMSPGVPVHYASMFNMGGVATGLLVKSFDGRPIKIEGNKLHSNSLGASSSFAQASVLDLYDPDRSRYPVVQTAGKAARSSWSDFDLALAGQLASGKHIAFLSLAQGGPTFDRLAKAVQAKYPNATFHTWEAIHSDNELTGLAAAAGRGVRADYDLSKASIIACFDADLLGNHPAKLRFASQWAEGRRPDVTGQMNRVYAFEANHSITGSTADHRLPAKPSRVGQLLAVVAARLGIGSEPSLTLTKAETHVIDALVKDLQANTGKSLIAVGQAQPDWVHGLALALNNKLGNIGTSVKLLPSTETSAVASAADLTDRLNQGKVDALIILDGNPVYDAPESLGQAIVKAKFSVHLSTHVNETSKVATWHLPMAHYLEHWNDGRSWDGTVSVQQPLILPLFEGRSSIELLARVAELPKTAGYDLVRETFATLLSSAASFEKAWRQVLHDGVVEGSAATPVALVDIKLPSVPAYAASKGFEIQFIADYSMYDGRFANNGWLQEAPDPMTKVTWDNAAYLSVATAKELGLDNEGMVEITTAAGKTLKMASVILPGVADGVVILPLGYGRKDCGKIGQNVGFNTYVLRTNGSYVLAGATVTKTAGKYALANVTDHHLIDAHGMAGRERRIGEGGKSGMLVRETNFTDYKKDKHILRRDADGNVNVQLFEAPHSFNEPHAWGMSIDMNSCIGCNACVIACQAENNVPVVGKTEVLHRREMHWLRIDRYFKGDVNNPDVVHMPLTCVHCENAPCEQVCPVAATTHDSEGINVMVYNRCIGTRYCSNNCPYKVRVFNYFDFHAKDPRGHYMPYLNLPDAQPQEQVDKLKQMVFNPEVTVRMRGVMEKCSYCSHRIQDAKIHAKVEHAQGKREREVLNDGEVVVACEEACSTHAIVFGDLNNPTSRVSKLQKSNRSYGTLEEMNLRPRTQHMAVVRNPAYDKYSAGDASPSVLEPQHTQQGNA